VDSFEPSHVILGAKHPKDIMAKHVGKRDYAGVDAINEDDRAFIESFIDRGYKE